MTLEKKQAGEAGACKTGWYVTILIERFEYDDEDKSDPERKCLAWENLRLIRASDPETAYRKAVESGKVSEGTRCVNSEGRRGQWKFVGVAELQPVYEPIQDGVEILWTEHVNKTVTRVERMVRKKEELRAFAEE